LKTKGNKQNKVNVITLGCSKNLVDSEVLITQLKAGGIQTYHQDDNAKANIAIVNTCGFIESAKEESVDTILQCIDAKERGDLEKVYVTGCLSHRYKDELEKEIPGVDAWFGTMELPLLLKKFKVNYRHELVGERLTTTASHYAYMKISEGCDRPCAFCAIPLMRGKHKSRPIEELVGEARKLVQRGVQELLLIAQDSTYYGLDLYGERLLSDLMQQLADVEGLEWIRLHYAYPSGFPLDILDTIAKNPNICNYLDIPLQHASDNVLSTMKRGITQERTERLLTTIREKVPNIALRTTMMVGHPGEEEKDFETLVNFIEKWKFERLGVFTYSHEEDTTAYALDDSIPKEVKEERANILMSTQEGISRELNEQLIGKTVKVIIDRKESGHFVGRTEYDSPEVDNEVLIDAKEHYLPIGKFADIRITDATEFDLYGHPNRA
jgi:ribosomal protein S12 methylthiotransferase